MNATQETKEWFFPLVAAIGLTAFSILYVVAELPTGGSGQLTELYADQPGWIMAVWSVAPAVAIILLGLGLSHPAGSSVHDQRFRRWIPWLLVAVSFWSLKSAIHLRVAGSASNDFYFTAATGPGAFTAQAMKIENAGDYLLHFPETGGRHWSEFGGTRVISNPPGVTLLIYGCRRLLEACPGLLEFYTEEPPPRQDASSEVKRNYLLRGLTQFAADVFLALAALGMAPLWWLAQALLPPEKAPMAATLAVFIPSLYVYSYCKDAFQMSMTLWFWWSVHRAWFGKSAAASLSAGVCLFVGLQFSLSFLVAAVVVAAVAVAGRFTGERALSPWQPGKLWLLFAAFAAGFLGPLALLWATTGYQPLLGLVSAYRGHALYHKDFGQPYSVWIWLNLFHLILFIGGPAAASLLLTAGSQVRSAIQRRSIRGLDPYFLGVSAVFVLLNFSGKNLGEVARLWLFFMPAFILASERARQPKRPIPPAAVALILLLQAVQAAVFTLKFDPLGARRALTGNLYQGLQ